MESLVAVLPYIQIGLSALLIATVVLQQRGSGLGGALGGDNFSATFHKRRGSEKTFFHATIILAVLFGLSALAALVF